VEVVGNAGLLANARSAFDIAAKLRQVLEDPALEQSLRARAVVQASRFSWSATASRVVSLLAGLPPRGSLRPPPRTAVRRRPARPRIAFVSPLPPKRTGVADYAVTLLDALASAYEIDVYHEPGYIPEAALAQGSLTYNEARLFRRQAPVRDY